MKPILILDNYDSFTYNIAHIVKESGYTADIYRNDKISVEDVDKYDKILLSPGPGIPSEAGILLPLIKRYAPTKSILGICLGEQAIGEAFGAKLENLSKVYHGIESTIERVSDNEPLFTGIEKHFNAGRYHSWVVSRENFPEVLQITAIDKETDQIMALRHKLYDVKGVQFHPESVLTPSGKQMIINWLNACE